ncbi:MAG: MBL fold metallo-hydrolase [Bacteroides sp.]|nr:MAG: MBL fold metallo-hydrolase [Bacteroides sp.]
MLKLIALNEGSYKFLKKSVPLNIKNNYNITVQPFLLNIKNFTYLIDTGLGFIDNDYKNNTILNNIEKYGYKHNDISKILITHLHPDHFGGLFRKNHNNKYEFNFPNSMIYVQKKEIEYFIDFYKNSLYSDMLQFLYNHKKTIFLNGNGVIDNIINYYITGGHTKYHQIFTLNNYNINYMFGGDIIAIPEHIDIKFKTSYDFDKTYAMYLRKKLTKIIHLNNYTCLLYHSKKYKIKVNFFEERYFPY